MSAIKFKVAENQTEFCVMDVLRADVEQAMRDRAEEFAKRMRKESEFNREALLALNEPQAK